MAGKRASVDGQRLGHDERYYSLRFYVSIAPLIHVLLVTCIRAVPGKSDEVSNVPFSFPPTVDTSSPYSPDLKAAAGTERVTLVLSPGVIFVTHTIQMRGYTTLPLDKLKTMYEQPTRDCDRAHSAGGQMRAISPTRGPHGSLPESSNNATLNVIIICYGGEVSHDPGKGDKRCSRQYKTRLFDTNVEDAEDVDREDSCRTCSR